MYPLTNVSDVLFHKWLPAMFKDDLDGFQIVRAFLKGNVQPEGCRCRLEAGYINITMLLEGWHWSLGGGDNPPNLMVPIKPALLAARESAQQLIATTKLHHNGAPQALRKQYVKHVHDEKAASNWIQQHHIVPTSGSPSCDSARYERSGAAAVDRLCESFQPLNSTFNDRTIALLSRKPLTLPHAGALACSIEETITTNMKAFRVGSLPNKSAIPFVHLHRCNQDWRSDLRRALLHPDHVQRLCHAQLCMAHGPALGPTAPH
ncbi:uncharacterized protein SPSC_03851 [Sporisorium scitamineum]|uniref:Uncharacterized protein n=1 Tax=Sporisorium scitamineum TaxID=49012 RepID=A0A127Z2Z0_9BASI|nr:uncharacterized protein SPSC_03851 [Sporisorium scitamineum]